MSFGPFLDLLLIGLLVLALAYGVRLEAKLKALREGQGAFAKAVAELNGAAMRAEAAMASMRAAAEETDELHGRILAARQLKTELETLLNRRPVAAPQPHLQPLAQPAREIEAARPPASPARADPASILQALAALRARNPVEEPAVHRAASRLATGGDDDLFETPDFSPARARRA